MDDVFILLIIFVIIGGGLTISFDSSVDDPNDVIPAPVVAPVTVETAPVAVTAVKGTPAVIKVASPVVEPKEAPKTVIIELDELPTEEPKEKIDAPLFIDLEN